MDSDKLRRKLDHQKEQLAITTTTLNELTKKRDTITDTAERVSFNALITQYRTKLNRQAAAVKATELEIKLTSADPAQLTIDDAAATLPSKPARNR